MNQVFSFQEKTYKQLLKKKMNEEIKTAGKFIKFCNIVYWFFVIGTIISAIATILYLLIWSEHPNIEWLLGIITIFFPYAFSYIPKSVVWVSLCKDYKFRKKNVLSIVQGNLLYSYIDDHMFDYYVVQSFLVSLNEINEILYNSKTGLITIKGQIKQEITINNNKTENDCLEFDFFNSYDIDIIDFLKNYVSNYCKITIV